MSQTYRTRALHDARDWHEDDIVLIEAVPCSSCRRDIRPDERIRRTSDDWQDGWVHADCASVVA